MPTRLEIIKAALVSSKDRDDRVLVSDEVFAIFECILHVCWIGRVHV